MLSVTVCGLACWQPLETSAVYSLHCFWALKARRGISCASATTTLLVI